MKHASLLTLGWQDFTGRLGGEDALTTGARTTKAFLRARGIRSAKPYVLAHLLMILMLEPLIGDFEDPSRRDAAA